MRLDVETIIRYIKGEASRGESTEVKRWIQSSAKHAFLYEKIKWRIQNGGPNRIETEEVDELWNMLKKKIISREKRISFAGQGAWYLAGAAVILVGIICGLLLRSPERMEKAGENVPLAGESTGTRIVLHDGKVLPVTENMKMGTMAVTPSATTALTPETDSVEYNTLIIAQGDMMRFTLADGTVVVLNGGSTLTYPTSFPLKTREVVLTGEAYFEVAPDRQKAFIVKTGEVDIRVLGTRFNVCGYSEDETFTTVLLEGSVRIENKASGKVSAMHPGEMYRYTLLDNSERIDTGNTSASIAWLERRVACYKQTLGQLLTRVERMYSIKIRVVDNVDENVVLDCDLPPYENYLELLQIICDVSDTKLLIKEKEVIVMPK